ncbi:MAG: class 1 fructose-bisphosphatase [Proteobacteria bacterium]|nr:class 1 fructose-bisphosphatase [Pseudomonadota bacterium]
MTTGTTLTKFILEMQRSYPEAKGEFTSLLNDIATAAKIVTREVRKAGLVDILGGTGKENVHGEKVQKLDVFANETFIKHLEHTGYLAAFASEEMDDFCPVPEYYPRGKYIMVMDPLDGSSNIDVNISIGTIFCIFKRVSKGDHPDVNDFLQCGRNIVAAGYVIYGSSTMLVYSTGQGVHGFTLDPSVGEFLLSHEGIKVPEKGKNYSINEGNYAIWDDWTKRYIEKTKEKREKSLRYVGTLVADAHRTLLKGGVFLYPGDKKNPKGKLRLLYECFPMAYLFEQAGGIATDGKMRILDKTPSELHERSPLIIGSKTDVEEVLNFIKEGM